MLDELIEEEEIKRQEETSKGTKRKKFAYYARTVDDLCFDNFIEENIFNKDFGKLTRRLMIATQKNCQSFHIIRTNGSDLLVNKTDEIDRLIESLKHDNE